MGSTFLQPELIESGTGSGRWMVVIYDNDTTALDDVINMLMRATGCTVEEACIETWEAQEYGKAPVHFAEQDECEIVAAMLGTIGVKTEVRREWND